MRWILLLLLALPTSLAACCMVPVDYPGDVDQRGQEVVIFHHDGHQEMVIRVNPFFQNHAESPEYFAWVLTVPSKPTAYDTADPGIFKAAWDLQAELNRHHQRNSGDECTGSADGAEMGGALDISESIRVGPYDITEVKANGVEALDDLNSWLKQKGFPTEDPDHMKWFVENDFTFLCIYILPEDPSVGFTEDLALKPLQVGFETERPYYPGKFSSQQGNFELRLHTVTSTPLDRKSLNSNRERLDYVDLYFEGQNLWTSKPLPKELADPLKVMPGVAGVGTWFVNTIYSGGFNPIVDGQPKINTWEDDVFFELGGEKDMPPEFYEYGPRPEFMSDGRVKPKAPEPTASTELTWFFGGMALIALVLTWLWLWTRMKASVKEREKLLAMQQELHRKMTASEAEGEDAEKKE